MSRAMPFPCGKPESVISFLILLAALADLVVRPLVRRFLTVSNDDWRKNAGPDSDIFPFSTELLFFYERMQGWPRERCLMKNPGLSLTRLHKTKIANCDPKSLFFTQPKFKTFKKNYTSGILQ